MKVFGLNITKSTTIQEYKTGEPSPFHSDSNVKRIISGMGTTFQTNCYNLCPPLQSIISKKAQGIINANILCTDSNKAVIKNQSFDRAMKLLDRPNKYNTQSEFIRIIETMLSVYGVCYVYKIIPVGFKDISSLVVIPNSCMDVKYKSFANIFANDDIVEYYYISMFGKTYRLDGEFKNRIIEIRDSSINLKNGYELRPYSKIDGLRQPIQNIVASLESRNQIIVKRGADVLLSPEPSTDKALSMSTFNPTEIKRIQDDYERYGAASGQWHALIPPLPMKVQQITRDPSKLGLFEGEDTDIRALLRAYNVPAPIFGLKDDAKYNTYSEAKTEFYEDGIIPDAKIICEGLDQIFDATKNGYSFLFDYSHLQCMQTSEKDKAVALKTQVEALQIAVDSGLMNIEDAKLNLKDYLS